MPWVKRWVGLLVAPQVGSIYNEGIWDPATELLIGMRDIGHGSRSKSLECTVAP